MGAEQDDKPGDGNEDSQKGEKRREPWWFKQPLPIDRFTGWLVAWTALLFVATVINAGILYITDTTLKETLGETRKASEAATKSVALAEKSLIAANRAWIAPDAVIILNKLALGKPLNLGITYRNIGKEPATDVTYTFVAGRIVAKEQYPEWSASDLGVPENKMCEEQFTGDVGVAYPNSPDRYAVTYTIEPEFTDTFIIKAQTTYFVQGCIKYQTLGTIHHAAYCFYMHSVVGIPPEKWNFRFCPTGNYAD